jgi:hypothetical protein
MEEATIANCPGPKSDWRSIAMINVMYDDAVIEVEGNDEALRDFSSKLVSCDEAAEFTLPSPSDSDTRELSYADTLHIVVTTEPLAVSRTNKALQISGSKETLLLLSENICWLTNIAKPTTPAVSDHLHVEYYPDHRFLAEGSLSLIVTRLN